MSTSYNRQHHPWFSPLRPLPAKRSVACLTYLPSYPLAVTYLLLPNPLADVFFAGIMMLSVIFALVGGVGTWTNRTSLVRVAALLLTGLSILGMMSVGFAFAPAALLLVGSALFSQVAGPRETSVARMTADSPSEREVVVKKLVGLGSGVLGTGLVYIDVFAQELFEACASETLACTLEKTNRGAVGVTILGSTMISFGGWLVWKQVYISRLLTYLR